MEALVNNRIKRDSRQLKKKRERQLKKERERQLKKKRDGNLKTRYRLMSLPHNVPEA